PDSSMAAYQRAIALDSSFADAFVLLGQEYKNAGDPERAIELTRQGLALAPDNATYLSILGGFLLQNGQPREALPYLEKAAALRPWGYRPVYNLGLALQRAGEETKSQKYLAKADTLRRLQSQVAHLQMQVQNSPEDFMRWVELGEILREMGNYRASRDALRSASLLEPNQLALQNNIAYLSLALGDTSEAIDIFQSIVSEDSAQTDVWFNLGVVFTETGRDEDAREAWQQVLKQTPNDTTAQNYLQTLSES
ncbi:MAG: tetratricopeptide repeat protein, partial [Candidatus Marinimicrobia bacterium]|nr:tetratricopeptide repeat protein [Candidatus Neomarinimicrobiota bacterium]